jgi:hypothetical protein
MLFFRFVGVERGVAGRFTVGGSDPEFDLELSSVQL